MKKKESRNELLIQSYIENGATETARAFNISRARVYQIIEFEKEVARMRKERLNEARMAEMEDVDNWA